MPKGYGYGELNPKHKGKKKKSVLSAVDNGHFSNY